MSSEANDARKMRLTLDLRAVVLVLLAVIVGMLFLWRPWSDRMPAGTRSIKVTGEATIQAEPDEFVFYPSYDFTNADRSAALTQMNQKSSELMGKLKMLGVNDKQIKSNSNGSDDRLYFAPNGGGGTSSTYSLQLTITVTSRDMAQKVQDYLVTTGPEGMVSPTANFSQAKRKSLESEARNKATEDARGKAEQTAKNLGAKLGKVKAVGEGSDFGGIMPFSTEKLERGTTLDTSRLGVQPGQNDLNYSVTVEFYLR